MLPHSGRRSSSVSDQAKLVPYRSLPFAFQVTKPMNVKLLLKLLLFTAGLLLINEYLTVVFSSKNFPPGYPTVNMLVNPDFLSTMHQGFYNEKKNSLDVVFLGSSHIFSNINPNMIWDQYGITSYDFSGHMQDLGTSYYYLQQVFETQSPKVVVIDIFLNGDRYLGTINAHQNFDFMKNDIHRIKAILNRAESNYLELFFPVANYHTRWKDLTRDEIFYDYNKRDFLKGSFIFMDSNSTEVEDLKIPSEIPESSLAKKTIHWMLSIQKLCKENNCQCVFIKTPFYLFETNKLVNFTDIEYYSYLSAVQKFCDENGMTFLNFVGREKEIGLDYANDYIDSMHMNLSGQEKFSSYIGKNLQENFQLENKKGDPDYEQWDRDYEEMRYITDNFSDLFYK